MDFIKLTPEKLSIEEINNQVTSPKCGAISLFVGTTRDNFEEKKVVKLEYEAYEPMAEKALKNICIEIRQKWKDIENIAIYHRLGNVPVAEASIVIAISSPHRKDSLEATQFCIDTVKKSVPIWKKEIYEDNDPKWKENTECPWSKKVNKNQISKPVYDIPNIPSHLIQINCSNEEINRRIETFMQRKREQANITNIRDFCGLRNDENSCARIDAVFNRRKDSKSHLKTQRVYNTYGPHNFNKSNVYISKAVEERVENLEKGLTIDKPVAPDIYERLKKIEDRILLLESVSPEYSHFWNKEFIDLNIGETKESITNSSVKKSRFEVDDVDSLLYQLEKEAQLKKI